jgi:oligopeptidase B
MSDNKPNKSIKHCNDNILQEPQVKRQKTVVKYGKKENEYRGEDLMDPPMEIDDYYYWLRDDKRENKEVLKYLDDENKYSELVMADSQDVQDTLYKEMKSRLKESDETYPYPRGDGGWNSLYRYFTKTLEGKSYPIYCRKNMETLKDEIILDVNEIAEGHEQCVVSNVNTSPDHKILAYAVDYTGDEKCDIMFKDLSTHKLLNQSIKQIYASFDWTPDNKYLYYSKEDSANRINELWKYDLLHDKSELLFKEDDLLFQVNFNISDDDNFLIVDVSSDDTSEIYYIDLSKESKLQLLVKRENGIKYEVNSHNNNFVILTNKDNAINFKLMYVATESPQVENWKEMIPHSPTEFIMGFQCFKDFIGLSIRHNCCQSVAVIDYDFNTDTYNKKIKYVELGEESYTTYFSSNCVFDTTKLRICYTSLTKPPVLYEYDMKTGTAEILTKTIIPNYDSSLYESKMLWVPSVFGFKVPLSIVYRKDKEYMGKRPTYLYGYGSYGICINPSFDQKKISLLDRGFIYAIAHVRGGAELGYQWYLDGKMYNKMNTFHDFINCAEFLIKENYTETKLLTIDGRSAGGLLMGVSLTMRPDLYNAVIAGVPFLDVLTTMADPSIPLTAGEWIQWGNSNKLVDHVYMRQYDPYLNLRQTNYPHTLIVAGLNDNRVQYWEPAKFMAKLRHLKTDTNIHLLKIEMIQGHFGGSDRYKYIKETAFEYAFVLKTLEC